MAIMRQAILLEKFQIFNERRIEFSLFWRDNRKHGKIIFKTIFYKILWYTIFYSFSSKRIWNILKFGLGKINTSFFWILWCLIVWYPLVVILVRLQTICAICDDSDHINHTRSMLLLYYPLITIDVSQRALFRMGFAKYWYTCYFNIKLS